MTREEAISILKSKMDGSVDTSYEWAEAVRMAIKALEQLEPHWISVTERLPEYGTQVLAIHKDGDYEINHVIDEEDGEWFLNGVIAWIPLPEPYREEGD